MSDPISSATKENVSAGRKFDTGTELPKKFELTDEFKDTYNLINETDKNLFITGKAGCGKSTLLEYFRQNTNKNHVILAPTGVTAIKAKGSTIHKFFKFPPRFVTKEDVKVFRDRNFFSRLETLLIDESSMIRSDIFDLIDLSLKKNRRNKKPFGGVQIILFGDLLQLSPVVSSAEKEVVEKFYPKGAYFFNARCFHSGKFVTKELSKIFRQTDVNFINLLNKFRIAKVDSRDLSIINKRMIKENSDLPKETIILSPRNSKVDEINNSKLNELQTETYTYTAKSSGTFKESAYPVKKELNLKVGAQIMITKNDQSEPQKWVNGTLATIEYLSKDEIKIKIKDKILNLPRSKWESIEYRLSGNKINPKAIGFFVAYPIKLAWAATIHKCQGQTFDHVAIDLDSGAFTHGQTYVALSRAKSIEGVHLLKEINQSDLIFDKNVFSFLGHKLEKKYIRELLKTNKIIKKEEEKNNIIITETDNWTKKDDNKLIVLYKKNVPEIALSKIFKKEISEIRSRILKLTVR